MEPRNDLVGALLSGFDADTRSGLLHLLEQVREEQIRAKRESAAVEPH